MAISESTHPQTGSSWFPKIAALVGGLIVLAVLVSVLASTPWVAKATAAEAVSYASLEEVRVAVNETFPCERFEIGEHPFMDMLDKEYSRNNQDGKCNDGRYLRLTWYGQPNRAQAVANERATTPQWDDEKLIGPNWEISATSRGDIEDLRKKMGGTPQWEIKP